MPFRKEFLKPGLCALAALALSAGLAVLTAGPVRGQSGATPEAPAGSATPNAAPLDLDRGAAGLWRTLLALHTRASLLMFTAHPDDEDGGMLAYESRGQGARAALMTLTRGEGGQNVMSDDFWDALGLVRTEEQLAADRYYGVDQFWSTAVDFGFSKKREEALALWDHDRVLADAVRVVRMTRPLVITAVFVGGPSDGHGQHAVSGEIAQEAFAAAGDPAVFPEQIRAGLRPWSPLKMYALVPSSAVSEKGLLDSATGEWLPVRFYDYIHKSWSDGLPPVNVRIPEGDANPLTGSTFLQIARTGLALEKSQNGGGDVPFAAPVSRAYHRFASLVPAGDNEQSFFDGVNVSLAGIADLAKGENHAFLEDGLARINTQVERALAEFSAERPEKIAPFLAEGLKQTNSLAAQVAASDLSSPARADVLHELSAKQEQFQRAIIQALGISLDAVVAPAKQGPADSPSGSASETFAYAVPGQQFFVRVHINNPGPGALDVSRVWLESPPGESWNIAPASPAPPSIPAGQAADPRFSVGVPPDAAPTRPYFTRPSHEQPYLDILDDRVRNLSFAPYPLAAWAEFTFDGVAIRDGQVVQTAHRQTGPGLVLNPLMIAPAVSVRIAPAAGVVPLDAKSFTISALVHTEAGEGALGDVKLELPPGWRSDPPSASFSLAAAGQQQNVSFRVFPDRLEEKRYTVTANADSGGRQYREGFTTVGYLGLRPYNLYSPATYSTSGVNVRVAPGLHVGYVTGTGDAVPQSLENMGVKSDFLSPQDIAQGNLQRFDVIVLGVRAYAARPELAANNSRLLDYVKNGGTVVVQYNTGEYARDYGPYPYTMPAGPDGVVVDETSPINFLEPANPLLSWPNQITARDFSGWVEERGHGFMQSWDSHWQAPLETHDPGQNPQKGGLIYAKYGRGVYVYLAFALYRQLPEGVPGAYRLFANLLSLPRNPALQSPASARPSRPAPAKP